MPIDQIDALCTAFARLPGLGPRSARRIVIHLLERREKALVPLLRALEDVQASVTRCATCGNIDSSNPCALCTDPRRDDRHLCVVENLSDLWALERGRLFPGRFHILGGRLSALDGVGPDDLAVDALMRRLESGGVEEVILAMSATFEGQTTMHYLAERLSVFPVRITQLAHGVPVGGELDLLDDGTLSQALRARQPIS